MLQKRSAKKKKKKKRVYIKTNLGLSGSFKVIFKFIFNLKKNTLTIAPNNVKTAMLPAIYLFLTETIFLNDTVNNLFILLMQI